MNVVSQYGPFIGRVLIAPLFIMAGWSKLGAGFAGTAAYIGSAGLPMPEVVAILTIIIEIGGGIALLIGWNTKWAALVLSAFTILAGVIFHMDFANQLQTTMLMKNLAIAGGLLAFSAWGGGKYSMDERKMGM